MKTSNSTERKELKNLISTKGTNALMCMITGSFVQEYLVRQTIEGGQYSLDTNFSTTLLMNVYTTEAVIKNLLVT